MTWKQIIGIINGKNMKSLILALMIIGTTSAFASFGTPDQDPIVNDLQNRFRNGTAPNQMDLINTSWTCKEMVSMRDDFRKQDLAFTFNKFDGYIQISCSRCKDSGEVMISNGKEQIVTFMDGSHNFTTAFRMDSNGYLISEFSVNNHAGDKENPTLTPIAQTSNDQHVVSYSLCIKNP